MKNNPLGTLLVGLLLLAAVATLSLAAKYFFSVKELERVNAQYVALNNTLNTIQALANEAVEYGKRNPAIDPILFQFELKPRPGTTTPGQPGSKPAPR